MPRRIVVTLLAVCLVLAAALFPRPSVSSTAGPATPTGWDIESVGDGRLFSQMTERALRLDSEGNPHYVYGQEHLYHAWHDGTKWNYETADGAHMVGQGASLALTADGTLHVAYFGHGEIKYAHKDAAGWHAETVVYTTPSHPTTGIAVDGSGQPYIVFHDGQLKHAHKDLTGWHVETIDASASWDLVSVAITPNDTLFVAYWSSPDFQSHYNLKLARRYGGLWDSEVVETGAYMPSFPSLAVGADGIPRMAWARHVVIAPTSSARTNSILMPTPVPPVMRTTSVQYAVRGPEGWVQDAIVDWQEVDSNLSNDTPRTTLALGSSDVPYVAYTRGDGLYLAYLDGSAWTIGWVALSQQALNPVSISMGVSGVHPHIVYEDSVVVSGWGIPTLRWLRHSGPDYAPPSWEMSVFEDSPKITLGRSLAVDAAGNPHVTYRRIGTAGPVGTYYAYRDAAGWHREAVNPLTDGGVLSDLTLDSTGRPHVAYEVSDGSQMGIKYAYRGSSGWTIVQLRSWMQSGIPEDLPSLALDGQGYPHLAYHVSYAVGGSDLLHEYLDSFGWHAESVDNQNGAYSSIRVDTLGRPHVAFLDLSSETLKYSYRGEDGWQTSSVVRKPRYPWVYRAGAVSSMVLDAYDSPHLAYAVFPSDLYSNADVCYATLDRGAWAIDRVDNNAYVWAGPSMAVSSTGQPSIAYVRNHKLTKYPWSVYMAYPDSSGGWQQALVRSLGDMGDIVPIALRQGTQPVIAYMSEYDSLSIAAYIGEVPIATPTPGPSPVARLLLPLAGRGWAGTTPTSLCGP